MANLANHLFRQAADKPSKVGLIFDETSYTFAEIAERVRRIAGGLAAQGVGIGSRVGLMVHSRPEFIFHQQAIFALGAIVSPLNIFYKRGDLAHSIESCELEYLIIGREFLDSLPDSKLPAVASVKTVFVLGLEPGEPRDWLRPADELGSSQALGAAVELPDSAIGMMLNTSATTGKAKGVMLSLANIGANYDSTPEWLGITGSSVILCALPLYNTFGLNQCINAMFVTGATLVLMQRFDAEKCLQSIERHRCSFFPAVPTMLQKIIDHPDAGKYDLGSVSRIMTGAAPVPAALLEHIYERMGRDTVVMTGYGLTEATAIVSLEHVELDALGRVKRPKSIGKVLPGMKMRLLAPDGHVTSVDEVGEICVQGPNVMAGYYKRPDDTAQAIVDGWLHTGDLGVYDEAGNAYIVDRKKDVIIRGGQNIYPADIEETLYHIDGVSEVAVIGAPDEKFGEVPIAFVAVRPGQTLKAEDLIRKCAEELAYYKVPAAIHFLPELPKGPTGKILRRGLRAE